MHTVRRQPSHALSLSLQGFFFLPPSVSHKSYSSTSALLSPDRQVGFCYSFRDAEEQGEGRKKQEEGEERSRGRETRARVQGRWAGVRAGSAYAG